LAQLRLKQVRDKRQARHKLKTQVQQVQRRLKLQVLNQGSNQQQERHKQLKSLMQRKPSLLIRLKLQVRQ
jgi:hypothetical protein